MKKISSYILLIGALALFIGLAPRFLAFDKIQKSITEQLSNKMGGPVTVQEMHWVWLPLPHLAFSNTSISNDYSEFSAPEMRIYPNWRIILDKKLSLGSIHLENPEIFISKKIIQTEKHDTVTLPQMSFFIDNGVLKIEADDNLYNGLPPDIFIFNNIDGMLKIENAKVEFDLRGSSPVSSEIDLQGHINISSKSYRVFLDLKDIALGKYVPALFNGHLIPLESRAGLAGTIIGTGWQDIEGDLHGTMPSFKVRNKERETNIIPGFADFSFQKSDTLFRLTIQELEMEEPRIKLDGKVERALSPGDENRTLQASIAEPIWAIDLNGKDLDLTAIRQKVLALWPENKVAKTVCNVVRNGRAISGAYRFSGPVAEFKNLDAMVIEADVLEAAIHVPGAELDLTRAGGPILIKNSVLTGHDLSARLGNSYGSNAEIYLGLAKESRAFTLDIDIDADLQALPAVLEQLVDHEKFLHELSRFSEVSGRASGNLRLGETLDNIITRVRVDDMELDARYEPLPETVHIDRGILHVEPQEVSWQEVKGRVGRQEVINTNGSVSWQAEDILLQINDVQAKLHGESLYAMLGQAGKIPEKIKNNLTALHGDIDLSQGALKGRAKLPETWEYDLALKAKEAAFTSPALPGQVILKDLSASLNSREVRILQAELNVLDQHLSITGALQHQQLGNWHGMVEFNGPLQARLADWISSKGWFSENLRPKIPCTMENMQISFKGKTIGVAGKILQGANGERLNIAKINLENTPEYLRIKELTIVAPGEQGTLTLDYQRQVPKSLDLSWQGFVNGDTIDALFHHSIFRGGTFAGVFFEASFVADKPEATRFKGLLKAEDLILKSSNPEQPLVTIKNILLNGTGEQIRIASLNLAVGAEKLAGSGHMGADHTGLQLDIDLTAPLISKEALDDLTLSLKEAQHVLYGAHADQENKLVLPENWIVTGRIGLDFDSYSVSRKTATPYSGTRPVRYVLHDMRGEMQMTPDALKRTEIFSAKLCGLDFKSSWYSDAALGQHFELATAPDSLLRLENVLPCLGVDQDLVEGDFSLKANLRKESGVWHSGNVYIRSSKGRILRLTLLSKIFTVVNITDLFTLETGSSGKKGFPYSQMDIDTHINENSLIFDRAILHGEGLNLFLQGDVHLDDYDADLTLLVAPFKTIDTLFAKVPLIGQPIMSEYDSLIAIPVAIKGQLPDPLVTPLHPKAVSGALLNIVKETIKLPYNIIKPNERPANQE